LSATPWTGLFKVDNVVLRHYSLSHHSSSPSDKSDNPNHLKKPVMLILIGLINYPDILDIHPERSMIRRFLEKGMDVYLVDWGDPPNILEKQIVFQDYVLYLSQLVDFLSNREIHIMGLCQGGVISLLFAALFPDRYKKLILFSSPVDFSYHNAFTRSFACINHDRMVRNFGNIPGELMAKFLGLFSPYSPEIIARKIQAESSKNTNPSFYQELGNWVSRSPAQAGLAFQEFGHDYIHKNKLIKSELTILGRQVELKNIHQPVLNIFSSEDHIWPPASSKALKAYLSPKTSYAEFEFKGGHVAAIIGKGAQTLIPDRIAEFIF
jgi:polyhydroxyalkanoate synthase